MTGSRVTALLLAASIAGIPPALARDDAGGASTSDRSDESSRPVRARGENVDALRDRPGDFVVNRRAVLYRRASADADVLTELKPGTIVHVVEVREQWYRVHSSRPGRPDGYIRRSYADPYVDGGRAQRGRPRRVIYRLTSPAVVREAPDIDSRRVTTLREGAEVVVVGRSGNWYRIESESGSRPPGYVPTVSAERVREAD